MPTGHPCRCMHPVGGTKRTVTSVGDRADTILYPEMREPHPDPPPSPRPGPGSRPGRDRAGQTGYGRQRGDSIRTQSRADPHHGPHPDDTRPSVPDEGLLRRGGHLRGDRLPRGPRPDRGRPRHDRPRGRRDPAPHGRRHPRHRPVDGPGAARDRGRLGLAGRGLHRRLGHVAARGRDQGAGRSRRRGHLRPGQSTADRRRRRVPRHDPHPRRGQGTRESRPLPCRAPPRRHRPAPRRGPPGEAAREPRHAQRARGTPRRAEPCRPRQLVRVLPPQRGRSQAGRRHVEERDVPHRGPPPPVDRPHGLRRRVHPARPPDRHDVPQGPEQLADRRPGRPGLAVRHRLGRRRARRGAPRPRHRRGLPLVRRRREERRPRARPRPGAAVLARPPLGHRAPRVVHDPARRHDRLRREPAQEVPGHLPPQLRQRLRGREPRGAAHRAALDRARRHDLPRRQPAHEAGAFLGVAAARDPADEPRGGLPLGGVHQAGHDAGTGAGGSTSRTRTSPGATRSGSSRSTCTSSRRRRAPGCARTSS